MRFLADDPWPGRRACNLQVFLLGLLRQGHSSLDLLEQPRRPVRTLALPARQKRRGQQGWPTLAFFPVAASGGRSEAHGRASLPPGHPDARRRAGSLAPPRGAATGVIVI